MKNKGEKFMNNKRFKFRFWCTTENRFVDDPTIGKSGDVFCIDGIAGRDTCHDVIVNQWTGMKDMNGTDIYEGDIVEWPGASGTGIARKIILFDEKSGYWRINGDSYDGFDDLALSMNGGRWNGPIKVIGNIYQNPDLIKLHPVPEVSEEEKNDDDPTCGGMLSNCEQCGETAWDGRICHACGLKEI